MGGALWWLALSLVISRLKTKLSATTLDKINRWSGIFVAAFGFVLLMRAFDDYCLVWATENSPVLDAVGQFCAHRRNRFFAISCNHVRKGREYRRGGDAIRIKPLINRFFPSIENVAQRQMLGLGRISRGHRFCPKFQHNKSFHLMFNPCSQGLFHQPRNR